MNVISKAVYEIFSPFHESSLYNKENLKVWQMALRDGTNLGLGIAKLIPGIANLACAVSVIKGIMVAFNSPDADPVDYVESLSDLNFQRTVMDIVGIFNPITPFASGVVDIGIAMGGISQAYKGSELEHVIVMTLGNIGAEISFTYAQISAAYKECVRRSRV